MSAFHDILFPLGLAFGASGGPTRRVDSVQLANGSEVRNTPHAQSRRRYNAASGVKSLEEMQALIAFFEARHGQLYSFRFTDPFDHMAQDQRIGIGDSTQTLFQLTKRYEDSAGDYTRPITKPRAGSIIVKLDAQYVPETDYDVALNTGHITFNTPPETDVVVTADFEFDVAVRFDTDALDISLEAFEAGDIRNIPLIEVLFDA